MTVFSVQDLSLELKFVKKLSRNCQVPVQLPVMSCPTKSLDFATVFRIATYIPPHLSQTGHWNCHACQLIRFFFQDYQEELKHRARREQACQRKLDREQEVEEEKRVALRS